MSIGWAKEVSCFIVLWRSKQAYGVVYRAHDSKHDKIVALKALRTTNDERRDGIPLTALREISLLKSLRHRNVVNVLDIAVGSSLSETHLVLEYAEQVWVPRKGGLTVGPSTSFGCSKSKVFPVGSQMLVSPALVWLGLSPSE